MRTDAPVPEHPAPPSSPASPQRIRLIDRITAYRQPIGLVFTLLLFGLALVACYHLLREIDPGALHDAIADVPRPALLGALSATALGFVILLATSGRPAASLASRCPCAAWPPAASAPSPSAMR